MSAFIRESENFNKMILNEPQVFIRYPAFLRKLIHNFELNGYTADQISSNLNRLARSKLPRSLLIKSANIACYTTIRSKLDAVPEELIASLREVGYRTILDFKLSGTKSKSNEATTIRQRPNQLIYMSRQNYDSISSIWTRPTTLTCPIDNQAHYIGKCPAF